MRAPQTLCYYLICFFGPNFMDFGFILVSCVKVLLILIRKALMKSHAIRGLRMVAPYKYVLVHLTFFYRAWVVSHQEMHSVRPFQLRLK